MEIAVTGASGYLGSALVRKHLERGDAVRALLRASAGAVPDPRARVFRGDLAHPESIPADFLEQADVLYHCAAELSREAVMHAVNVAGTHALAERARGRIGHWVQVSTIAVYGRPREGIITEESPVRPAGPYASTKAEADRVVAEASRGAFSYTVLRSAGIFGRGMRNPSLYDLISALDAGRFFFVGNAGAAANYIHEDNIVHALLLCGTLPPARQRVYNLSDYGTLEQMITLLCGELDKPVPWLRIPESPARMIASLSRLVPAFPLTPSRVDALTTRVRYPNTRIERELGYRRIKSLEDGVVDLVSEWRRRSG